jgi:dihydrofolate reductase
MVSIIVATGKNRVIGKNNQLIWYLPADLKRYKQLTMGHHIVMGRKTFDSIGKALPGRTSVIITHQKNYTKENCIIAHSVENAIELSKNDTEIFIDALPLTDKIYLTQIHQSFDGDTFFPPLNPDEWKIIWKEDHQADEKNKYDYSFIDYERFRG